jgi:hypothetical protein
MAGPDKTKAGISAAQGLGNKKPAVMGQPRTAGFRWVAEANPSLSNALGDNVLKQVHHAIAVAPLIVVPAHQFEETAVELNAGASVEDAALAVVDEI